MWKDREFSFDSIFEDLDKEFARAEEMLNRAFENSGPGGLSSYYYGYQVTVGPDGKPHVREFGNVRPSAKGLATPSRTREPLVDTIVDEKKGMLTITAEMPGVTKQDVKVTVADGSVVISAEKGGKKYHAEVPVSVALDDKSAKAVYANGILELKIKLKELPKSTEVKVE
jgi:HSP20 family protein